MLAPLMGRSPHGERGLKYGLQLVGRKRCGRSPHGERGLKSAGRGVWTCRGYVALLMESVD